MVEQETDASFGFVRVNYHYNITAADLGYRIYRVNFLRKWVLLYEYGWFRVLSMTMR